MAIDITKLNKAQSQAVAHGPGPVILVAGAGTGKTTVVTNRIAWLISQGQAKPEEILALTFTEKAAAEMEERVDQLLPLGYSEMWIHTFHAFCQRLLVQHALDIGLPSDFKVLDATSAWMLVRDKLNAFRLDYYKPIGNPTKFIHALIRHFSRCKDEGVYPEDYVRYAEGLKLDSDQTGDRQADEQEVVRVSELAEAYHQYQQLLLDHNALDFGDLINYTLKLFQTRPAIVERYRRQFSYLLVDEFQDTNWAQYQLVKILAAPKNNLMVVGDDDQSIYKFRGASFSNILTFKKDYPQAAEIYLTENYRSGQKILDLAYNFIQLNNPDRLEVKLATPDGGLSKKLTSRTGSAGAVSVLHYESGDDEIRGVIEKIVQLKEQSVDFSWSDVAILVRANDQAQGFVRYFRSVGLPHQFLASKGLYSQEIILVIMSYLKLLDNYHESQALYKVLSVPVWGLEPEDVISLNHLASKKSWSLWQALQQYHGQLTLSAKAQSAIHKFLAQVMRHTDLAKRLSPSVLIYRFLEDSGYLEVLTLEDSKENREQMLYLNQFFKKVRGWEEEHLEQGVHDFTQYLNMELESGEQGSLEQDIEEGPENIKILTIHGAKGLEWRYVFLVGLVHLRFPTIGRQEPIQLPEALIKDILPEGEAHLQEERRLLYVALTRAKEKVFLTYASRYGQGSQRRPSRFLSELGLTADGTPQAVTQELILTDMPAEKKIKYKLPKKFSYTQLKAFDACPKQYYYAHIIKIPVAGRATFSFGKIMHKVLERFFDLVRQRARAAQSTLFQAADEGGARTVAKSTVSEKELIELYEQLWEEDWFFDADNKQQYHDKGRRLLKEFYAGLGADIPVPLHLEQKFNLKLGSVSLSGVIDRIDPQTEGAGDQWKIIDYKTGKPPAENKLQFKDKEQLLIYQIASHEVFGKKVAALGLYFLETQKLIEFLGTDKELDKVRQVIVDTVEAIRESDFQATPGFWCRSCDFRYICPAAQL